jgi:putative RecB family exonuclease
MCCYISAKGGTIQHKKTCPDWRKPPTRPDRNTQPKRGNVARPSAQEVRARIDLERLRNAALIDTLMEEARKDGSGARSMTLAVLDAIAKWWNEESVRLESSQRRADATNRKEYRVAARQAEAIAASIRQHGCADDGEPATCDSTHAGAMGDTLRCTKPAGHDDQHHDGEGHAWPNEEPTRAESASDDASVLARPAPNSDVIAYLSGDSDMPPTASTPVAVIEEPAPVQPQPFVFADPAPIGDTIMSSFVDPPSPGRRPGARVFTFADLAEMPAGAPPDHRSISQLKDYADCGLKYRLGRRERVSAQPQWALVGGRAFHSAVEEMERAAAAGLDAPGARRWSLAADVFQDYKTLWETHLNREMSAVMQANPGWPMDSWRASARGQEGYTWWLAEGPDMLDRYMRMRAEWDQDWAIARAPDGTPIIEYEFVLNVDGVPFKGVIDQAWVNRGTGALRVRDVKTGARAEIETLQLRAYGYALRFDAGIAVLDAPDAWTGDYWSARKGTVSEPAPLLTDDGWAELCYRIHAMDRADRGNVHLPRPSTFCAGCGVKHACPVRAY